MAQSNSGRTHFARVLVGPSTVIGSAFVQQPGSMASRGIATSSAGAFCSLCLMCFLVAIPWIYWLPHDRFPYIWYLQLMPALVSQLLATQT